MRRLGRILNAVAATFFVLGVISLAWRAFGNRPVRLIGYMTDGSPRSPLPLYGPSSSGFDPFGVPYAMWLLGTFLLAITLRVIAVEVKAFDRCRAIPVFRCPQCGYDLRATPDRCPECGTEVKPQPAEGAAA